MLVCGYYKPYNTPACLFPATLGGIKEKPTWQLEVDVCVAEFATKSPGDFPMQITAIVLCVGGSMVRHSRLMPISMQMILDGSQEKTI